MNYEIAALAVFAITKMIQMLAMFFSLYQQTKEPEHTYLPLESHTGATKINMKTQQVSVDFWAMAKSMLTYGALTALCWVMLRLFGAVFMLPRRMRQQQQTIQESLQELQVTPTYSIPSHSQQVKAKSMLTYGALTALCWVMMRLFGAVFTLPRRMRQQQQTIQEPLQELQVTPTTYSIPSHSQQVMAKSTLTYGALTALCSVMMRLFGAVFTLPRRMRQQQQTIQEFLQELQRRFPDLNITEEDLMNAEKELDDLMKEIDEKPNDKQLMDKDENEKENTTTEIEDKKTI